MTSTSSSPRTAARLAARQPDGKRPVVMVHRWESLLFLHWRVTPEQVQQTLPAGLTVDTFNDEAYIGITPFFMRDVRVIGTPALPWFSSFQELNVRTYVFDTTGTPGIWFYSLDCNQPLAVIGARTLTGLPYFKAEMTAGFNDAIQYSCRRRGTDKPAFYQHRGIGPARPATPESLEFFLLERYYLFSLRNGRLLREQVSHAPYRYRGAEVLGYSTIPAELDGLTQLSGPPVHSCFVDAVEVKVFATQRVG